MSTQGPILADPVLGMAADVVDDLEGVRIANQNRYRQLTDTSELGHGLDRTNPDIENLYRLLEKLDEGEKLAIKNLEKVMERHPLWNSYGKNIVGVGAKQLARLLAVIGDPYWNDGYRLDESGEKIPLNRPRTRGELAAYCGVHVVNGQAPTRRRGQKANWNETARKRVWLIASQTIKYANSQYRAVYDAAREQYAEAVHLHDCVRCGPKGNPAVAGSPLSAGHQHARAIRKVMHAILNDLWEEARKVHEASNALAA